MDAPTSATLAEAYIKNMEHKQIHPILIKHQINEYFRYADDILLIYDQRKTEETFTEFNKQQKGKVVPVLN
jgi:ABC-type nitrate/sulfonate/bicarbonate transport system ATPase subunit